MWQWKTRWFQLGISLLKPKFNYRCNSRKPARRYSLQTKAELLAANEMFSICVPEINCLKNDFHGTTDIIYCCLYHIFYGFQIFDHYTRAYRRIIFKSLESRRTNKENEWKPKWILLIQGYFKGHTTNISINIRLFSL